jgi:hypothetical protein
MEYTLADVVRLAIESSQSQLWTAMPGRILAYYPTTQTADVHIICKDIWPTMEGGLKVTDFVDLRNIPVVWPRSSAMGFMFHLSASDGVLVLFASRSIENWRATGQEDQQPIRSHMHNFTDAFCLPGFFSDVAAATFPNPHTVPDTGGITTSDGKYQLRLVPTGAEMITSGTGPKFGVCATETEVKLGNQTSAEYVALASKVATELGKISSALSGHSITYTPGSVAAADTKAS